MKELSLKAKIIIAAVVTLLLSTVLYFKDGERLIDGGVLKRPDKGVSYVDVTAFVEGTDEGIANEDSCGTVRTVFKRGNTGDRKGL